MNALTPRRAGYAIVAAALLAAGLSTGVRFYYLLFGLMLVMLLVGAIGAVWTLISLRFDIEVARRRVARGGNVPCTLSVRHTCPLPVSDIRVMLDVPSGHGAGQAMSVSAPPFVKRAFRQVAHCPHRGSYEVGVARVRVTDLFGLITLSRRPRCEKARVDVRLRLLHADPLPPETVDQGPAHARRALEDNASPTDVRAWQSGDELKKVHWKLSLRKRELMVRTYEETARPDTLIIPDLAQFTPLIDRQLTLEDGVCEAALAAARAQLAAGWPVRVPLTGARPTELNGQTPLDIPAIQESLARARFDSPYGYEQVLTLMLGRMQRTGGAMLVTPRLTTRVADMALRMRQTGMAIELIWISGDTPPDEMRMLERLRMAGARARRVDPWGA